MGFSRQGHWSGLLRPPPEDLPNPGIKPESLTSPAMADRFLTTEPPENPQVSVGKANSQEKSASVSRQWPTLITVRSGVHLPGKQKGMIDDNSGIVGVPGQRREGCD